MPSTPEDNMLPKILPVTRGILEIVPIERLILSRITSAGAIFSGCL
jgi:hypothetical protein